MRVGNKNFPYPVLNAFQFKSDFKDDSIFKLKNTFDNGDVIRTPNSIILKDICFELEDEELLKLYNEGKVKASLIVEASASVFRHSHELNITPNEIVIPIHLLKGEVTVSSYLYACEDILDYQSNGFNDDYLGYTINIEKYSILAVDDGFKFIVSLDEAEDNNVSSIFTIVRIDENSDVMKYENTSKKIKIFLPQKHFKNYESLKMQNSYTNEFLSMLIIPVLTCCLYELQESARYDDAITDISDITYDKAWFKSICLAYEREQKKKLTIDEFIDCSPLELAQIVLNYSSLKGMKEFSKLILQGDRGDDNE